MRTILTLIASLAFLLIGCKTQDRVIVATGTSIGVDIDENPATGLYHAKMGYNRGEFAMVPSTNKYTPDVLMEIRYSGIFSRGDTSGIYQRLAVGAVAVSQPGAMAMFLKDPSGNVSTNTVAALKSLASIPTVNVSTTASLVKVAAAYRAATDKVPWDNVAKASGYASMAAFLIDPNPAPDKVTAVQDGLRSANLIQ
jgi:hypothetical protein